MKDENQLFQEWQGTSDPIAKGILQAQLISKLRAHAFAVCWNKMRERRPDIVNQAIERVLTRSDSFKGDSKFSTWFHTIVTNIANSVQAEEYARRGREVELEDIHESPAVTEGHITAKVTLDEIMEKLTHRERILLQGKLNGDSEEEIARMLDLPGTIRLSMMWLRLKKKIRHAEAKLAKKSSN